MPRLKATFKIDLSYPIRTQIADNELMTYVAKMNAFHVTLQPVRASRPRTQMNDQEPILHASQIVVSVSHEEPELPPIEHVEGGRNLQKRCNWFLSRHADYREVACRAANRFVEFCKYVLHTPYLKPLIPHQHDFKNALWTDERGERVETGIIEDTCEFLSAGGPQLLGQLALTKADESKLLLVLRDGATSPSSAREFRSNAQSSTKEGNYRRAVLELAIACEVAIKRAFFESATPAGAAFEYLEDKGKLNVRAIDLLDGPAQEAFSDSFKTSHSTEYQLLDYLFRCRNKVAHRAEAIFRDDKGIVHVVDHVTLQSWWSAVDVLFTWIESMTKRPA